VPPIYVETCIRCELDELWEKTQNPALHERWDLRFTDIDYLPREDESEPQRFRYTTRIGLGLSVGGGGESTGERHRPDGSRASALRFWSDERLALIARGSGYWRYVPAGDGVRFLTRYDYDTRHGRVGKLIDRIVFRPLMGWATAWSFDRLRLWLEDGISPEGSRNRALGLLVGWAFVGGLWPALRGRTAAARRVALVLGVTGLTAATYRSKESLPLARRCLRTPLNP